MKIVVAVGPHKKMKRLVLFFSWCIILAAVMVVIQEIITIATFLFGEVDSSHQSNEIYFYISSALSSFVVGFIFWNFYLFIKTRSLWNLKLIAWGLIVEMIVCGSSLLLPYNLLDSLESQGYSDLQIYLISFFSPTPGGVAGGLIGGLLLYLVEVLDEVKK